MSQRSHDTEHAEALIPDDSKRPYVRPSNDQQLHHLRTPLLMLPNELLHRIAYGAIGIYNNPIGRDDMRALWTCGDQHLNAKIEYTLAQCGRVIRWSADGKYKPLADWLPHLPVLELSVRAKEEFFARGFHGKEANVSYHQILSHLFGHSKLYKPMDLRMLQHLQISGALAAAMGFVRIDRGANVDFGDITPRLAPELFASRLASRLPKLKTVCLTMPLDVVVRYVGNQPYGLNHLNSPMLITKETQFEKCVRSVTLDCPFASVDNDRKHATQSIPVWMLPPSVEKIKIRVPMILIKNPTNDFDIPFYYIISLVMALRMLPPWLNLLNCIHFELVTTYYGPFSIRYDLVDFIKTSARRLQDKVTYQTPEAKIDDIALSLVDFIKTSARRLQDKVTYQTPEAKIDDIALSFKEFVCADAFNPFVDGFKIDMCQLTFADTINDYELQTIDWANIRFDFISTLLRHFFNDFECIES